jgi:hypothetical protein
MKITIDVDCTPEEARRFLGLPDVAPVQAALMQGLQERLTGYLEAADPETLLKAWAPAGLQGWEQLQKMFWGGLAGAGRSKASGNEPADKG